MATQNGLLLSVRYNFFFNWALTDKIKDMRNEDLQELKTGSFYFIEHQIRQLSFIHWLGVRLIQWFCCVLNILTAGLFNRLLMKFDIPLLKTYFEMVKSLMILFLFDSNKVLAKYDFKITPKTE